ncbi:LysR family transcriptional regulator [Zhaonella formicivorans]|uniref:LysR family transcriptional regulator n=1 Tax=Zhaonella formicivorans TaxID=2528593 RepID=UPI0010EC30ED|nr:LysR family transcriptional regulator [Zhaonella formicivorans]
MSINFELYKVFYYVAKHLSFSEASNQLYISQSAVSQAIKSLEENLGCKLFMRHTKQVKLTQEGEILFKHVEQAFNFLKAGERSISEVHSLQRGEVKIGASDTICKYFLLPSFKKFNELYPNITIRVTNRTSPACLELLQKGLVDVSIINLPEKETYRNISFTKIKAIHDVFIAGKKFEYLKHKTLSLKDLEKYPLLMLEKHSVTRTFFDNFLRKNNVFITPEIELGSVDLLIEMAKIGLGIAFVSKEYIARELQKEEVFILNLKEEVPERYLGIAANASIPLPAAAQKFAELLGHK